LQQNTLQACKPSHTFLVLGLVLYQWTTAACERSQRVMCHPLHRTLVCWGDWEMRIMLTVQ